MRIPKYVFYLSIFIIITVFAGFFPSKKDVYFEISKNMELFGKVYKEISFNYVDEIDPEEFMRAGIQGMLNSLDPYTIFIDEEKQQDIELITSGKYGGVGISIGVRGDKVTVIEVLDGYSAQKQGVRVGDILIQASGKKISPENVDDISSLVKGEPGTAVELKIVRNDGLDTLLFDLIREEVIVKNLTYAGFYPKNSGNVYLKLSNFSRSAGDEIKSTLKKLKEEKEIKSIILDLRGNPGGLLDIAVDVCDKFLPSNKLIVTTKGRESSSERKYYSVQEPMVGSADMIILINEGSASASEIVAGAMQDHDRAVLLGSKSFGKGLVQTISPLSYNTSLKITTAKYYTPSGRSIQKINYSEENKVFADFDSTLVKEFYTTNGRKVFSGGGVSPDTTVPFDYKGDITKELLAKGMFFKFADNYFYNNSNATFNSIKDEAVFSSFEKYLNEKEFDYQSEAEKQINRLLADLTKKDNERISQQLKNIEENFRIIAESELRVYKNEILRELKAELASRYLGSEGKIEELLNNDLQFQTAVKILANKEEYNRLLKY